MFLLIFLSLMPERSLSFHWILNWAFFFLFTLTTNLGNGGYYCNIKGRDGHSKLGKLYFRLE